MAEWEIKRALGQCSGTGEEFQAGKGYFAALVDTAEGFERRDYSIEYWEQEKPETYCFWKTKMGDPEQKKKMFIDDEMLMAFFERLAEEVEQEKIDFRFVLTLILMQKRKLKYLGSELREEQEWWKLRVAGEGREVEVVNPHLSEDQIEDLNALLIDWGQTVP